MPWGPSVRPHARTPWLSPSRIADLVQVEPALLLGLLVVCVWLVRRLFLRDTSAARATMLDGITANLWRHAVGAAAVLGGYFALDTWSERSAVLEHAAPWAGLAGLVWGAVVTVKSARLGTVEMMFLRNPQRGVPMLFVDALSVVLSLVMAAWVASAVFNFQMAPLLATSAAASIVLGLALQDPLSNLFAGITLQFDKPFGIGDQVEIHQGAQKWSGQIVEVTWRATTLVGAADELISIPNRTVSQSQIVNYTARALPVSRALTLRFDLDVDREAVRETLREAALGAEGVEALPPPVVVFTEVAEHALVAKLVYAVRDHARAVVIADRVLSRGLDALAAAGIALARPLMQVRVDPSPRA